ncbi:MAG: xanthine dehydrogenase accessory protein XdhC [Pseudomonadota bacterium]|nr:xanthine dehydrogenase accessory protein XdhC [Pseudomonadota bacterium]
MLHDLNLLLDRLRQQPAVLVTVARTEGSAPREAGAWMAVWPDAVLGTIGGGHLEWQAMAHARQRMAAAPTATAPQTLRYPLGPSLGQCCGGVVWLCYENVCAADAPQLRARLAPRIAPVTVFGGGHVGQAVVRLLADLPFALTWVDSRDEIFPPHVPAHVACVHSDPVQAAVADMPAGSRVLIMSFSHAQDLDIVAASLQRQRGRGDVPYIGLIGSRTKWAVFSRRLRARGFGDEELAHVTCPIGLPGITGKQPAVVAVAVAAQLLQKAS